METDATLSAFGALSHVTRLEAFRLLVTHEPDGLAAGDLARLLSVPQNTLSAHLNVLARANLVTSERQGRSITIAFNWAGWKSFCCSYCGTVATAAPISAAKCWRPLCGYCP
jgi:ArsR family transcriptional regulator